MKLAVFPLILALITGCERSGTPVSQRAHQNEILNGEILNRLHQYPAQRSVVMIQALSEEGAPVASCTAVLIGENIGLTSAHCLEEQLQFKSFKVLFGLSSQTPEANHRQGLNHATHPNYQTDVIDTVFNFTQDESEAQPVRLGRRFDLAVFSFAGKLPPGFRPARYDRDQLADRSYEMVDSYGAGHLYHPHQMPKIKLGASLYGRLARGQMQIGPDFRRLEDLYFTNQNSEAQVCSGDSGGPQFLADATEPTVVGIHSARLNNALSEKTKFSFCGDVSLVTKVAPFSEWIEEKRTEFERELRNKNE